MDLQVLRQQHYNASVTEIERHGDDLAILRVRPDAPLVRFEAGQWIRLGLGLWEPRCAGCPEEHLVHPERQQVLRRPYSLSCGIWTADGARLIAPDDEREYEFYVALSRELAVGAGGAALTARLLALQAGDRLWVDAAPRGNYTLASVGPDDDVLFLATGTGEAPHNRMICELLRRRHSARIASVVTVRQWDDLVYRAQHERLAERFPNYRYLPIATRETSHPEVVSGSRLQHMLEDGTLEAWLEQPLDPHHCHVFLCGNPDMLGRPRLDGEDLVFPEDSGMIELLHARGFPIAPPNARVHFERY